MTPHLPTAAGIVGPAHDFPRGARQKILIGQLCPHLRKLLAASFCFLASARIFGLVVHFLLVQNAQVERNTERTSGKSAEMRPRHVHGLEAGQAENGFLMGSKFPAGARSSAATCGLGLLLLQ